MRVRTPLNEQPTPPSTEPSNDSSTKINQRRLDTGLLMPGPRRRARGRSLRRATRAAWLRWSRRRLRRRGSRRQCVRPRSTCRPLRPGRQGCSGGPDTLAAVREQLADPLLGFLLGPASLGEGEDQRVLVAVHPSVLQHLRGAPLPIGCFVARGKETVVVLLARVRPRDRVQDRGYVPGIGVGRVSRRVTLRCQNRVVPSVGIAMSYPCPTVREVALRPSDGRRVGFTAPVRGGGRHWRTGVPSSCFTSSAATRPPM